MNAPGTGPGSLGLESRLVAATTVVLLTLLGLEVFGGDGLVVAGLKVAAGVAVILVGLAWGVAALRRR